MAAEAIERGPIGLINGVLVAGAGVGLAIVAVALNDGVTIVSQTNDELARREQAGLIPSTPDDKLLREATNFFPTLEAVHVRPQYQHAISVGERSVTLVFPDVEMERQAQFAALEAVRIRRDESITIQNNLTDVLTPLGMRRGDQDQTAGLFGALLVLCSTAGLALKAGFVENRPFSIPHSTPVSTR